MERRRIGDSELEASIIGLGCMSLGTDEQAARKLIDEAIEYGINYFDTADLYNRGLNEELVGKALKDKRKNIILATKVGNRFTRDEVGWSWDPSKAHIKQAVKDSLSRLQTDYIDLYQLHGGTIEDHIDETIEAFEELKQEGIIRYYGISSIRPNVIREYVKRSSIISVMMQYSLLDRRPEEWFEWLAEQRISVLARGPVAKGLLTERPLEQAPSAIKSNGYLAYSFAEIGQMKSAMSENSERKMNELALNYCLAHPVVASVIAGASTVKQLDENIQAVRQPELSTAELSRLKEISKPFSYEQHR